jgi:DNA-binding NarL/FixJ family response regulator
MDHMKEGEAVSVLIVDDSEPFRAAARAVVEVAEGFTWAGEAETGEDALEVARALQPELVLMDVNMPGIGGCEATRRLRVALPRTVVVLMSTYDSIGVPHAAGDCGASHYLQKEAFGPETLRMLWERFVPPKAA